MEVISGGLVKSKLPKRSDADNKYTVGASLAITGSRYMTGAAVFAAKGALLCGTGLLYQSSPKEALPVLQSVLYEPVFLEDDIKSIGHRLSRSKAVLFGCGCENSYHNGEILEYILSETSLPTVLDATAFALLEKNERLLSACKNNVILTPHEGEASRIFGKKITDRAENAREFCEKYGCVLVLKGKDTIVAQGGRMMQNPTGSGAMARGGFGDVLAGMILAFASQGLSPYDSALCGTYIHGLAGDMAREKYGELSVLPENTLPLIPDALKKTAE